MKEMARTETCRHCGVHWACIYCKELEQNANRPRSNQCWALPGTIGGRAGWAQCGVTSNHKVLCLSSFYNRASKYSYSLGATESRFLSHFCKTKKNSSDGVLSSGHQAFRGCQLTSAFWEGGGPWTRWAQMDARRTAAARVTAQVHIRTPSRPQQTGGEAE